jgi:uncharacterized protein (TIGR03118 family)
MHDETTAWITAETLSSEIWRDDSGPAFLSPAEASYRQTVLRHHHHNQLFSQDNLVSDDQPGHLNAQLQDPDLINPWGVAFSPKSDFWVNNNATGTATVYHVDPTTNTTTASTLVVTIAPPAGGTGPAAPTGIVFNTDSSGFMVNGTPASFIMDTEDGTISAWAGGTETTLEVDNSNNAAAGDNTVNPAEGIGAVYKGLAIATDSGGTTRLYAANFRHGTVDVFNDQFQQIQSLTDGSLPAGYAPFNVQVLNGDLFVTYAKQDQFKHDDVAGAGNGFVDEYTLNGQLVARVESGGPLNSPWGMAIAPADFGKYAGDLLVGNFGDGTISAFDLQHHDQFMGKLLGIDGKPITIPDLWTLTSGNGSSAGSTGQIYFTSGVQNESAGLFGALAPVPRTNEFMVSGGGSHGVG